MTLNSGILWQMLLEKYPDGVDVQAVNQRRVIETTVDAPQETPLYEWRSSEPQLVETIIELTEIEPETGIYSAMSEKTHRVYVFVDIEEHGVI